MADENRVSQLSVAKTPGELAGEAAAAAIGPRPGEGGWTPSKIAPIVGACVAGGLSTLGAALMAPPPLVPLTLVGAFLVGCGGGIAGYFGIKSAGPRSK